MRIADIVTNIDRRLAELEAELDQLSGARMALIDSAQPAAARTPRRRTHASARRSAEAAPAGKLIVVLSRSQGMSTRELAQRINGDPAQVLTLLKEQEHAGQVRRTGTRAATRWHVIADEDRIAARTAELQGISKRTRRSQELTQPVGPRGR